MRYFQIKDVIDENKRAFESGIECILEDSLVELLDESWLKGFQASSTEKQGKVFSLLREARLTELERLLDRRAFYGLDLTFEVEEKYVRQLETEISEQSEVSEQDERVAVETIDNLADIDLSSSKSPDPSMITLSLVSPVVNMANTMSIESENSRMQY